MPIIEKPTSPSGDPSCIGGPSDIHYFCTPTSVPTCVNCNRPPKGKWLLSIAWSGWFDDPTLYMRALINQANWLSLPLTDKDQFFRIVEQSSENTRCWLCRECFSLHCNAVKTIAESEG